MLKNLLVTALLTIAIAGAYLAGASQHTQAKAEENTHSDTELISFPIYTDTSSWTIYTLATPEVAQKMVQDGFTITVSCEEGKTPTEDYSCVPSNYNKQTDTKKVKVQGPDSKNTTDASWSCY